MQFFFKGQKFATEPWEKNLLQANDVQGVIDVDTTHLSVLVDKQIEIIRKNGKKPDKIFIGDKVFRELTGQTIDCNINMASLPINLRADSWAASLNGLTLIPINYFNGILVTPRD